MQITKRECVKHKGEIFVFRVCFAEPRSLPWFNTFRDTWSFNGNIASCDILTGSSCIDPLTICINDLTKDCVNNELISKIHATVKKVDELFENQEKITEQNKEELKKICDNLKVNDE